MQRLVHLKKFVLFNIYNAKTMTRLYSQRFCFSSPHYQNTIKKGSAEILQNAIHDSLNVQSCSTSAGNQMLVKGILMLQTFTD